MADPQVLVRAPVLSRTQDIVGYDLRLASSAARKPGLMEFLSGTNEQEDFFARLPSRFALTDTAQVEPSKPSGKSPGRVVVEIDPSQTREALLPQMQKWKAAGYGVCLQQQPPALTPDVLDVAGYFELDGGSAAPELEKTCKRLRRHAAKQLAVDVTTVERFDNSHRAGCDLFRGYFFTQLMDEQTQKTISPNYATIVSLMKQAQANAPVAKIEETLKRDAALSFKLLRYINSAGFGLSCEIQSFRHAVTVLGYQNLYRWLSLLLVTAARQSASAAVVTTAITRGRLAELIGEELFDKQERDNLFIVGAFSLLDVMLKTPLKNIAEQVPLADSVLDALLRQEGPYGPILSLVVATESFDRPETRAHALEVAGLLGIGAGQLNRAQIDAIAWAENLGQ